MRRDGGQILTIVEILLVVLVIVGAGLWLSRSYLGGRNSGKEPAHTPRGRALGVDCQNNLRQIRYAVTIVQQTGDQSPPSLRDLESSGITPGMTICPVSKQPYGYDPAQGRVWCTTPGHERY